MPPVQHPCPCPWFQIRRDIAWGFATAGDVAAALAAARTAAQAHAVEQANRAARDHSCAAGCARLGRITWPENPQAAFIVSAYAPPGGNVSFTGFAYARYTAELRCKLLPPGLGGALEDVGLGDAVLWEMRSPPG